MRCDCVVMLTVRPKYVVYCSLTKFHLYIVPILENTSIRNVVHSIAFILPCSVQYFWWIVDKKMIYVNKSFQYCFRTEFRHIVNCAAARVLVWRLWLSYKHLVWNESVVITTARGMFWGQDNYGYNIMLSLKWMMASWHENVFCISDPLWGESIGDNSPHKYQCCGALTFSL